jgi:hypothetical protein
LSDCKKNQEYFDEIIIDRDDDDSHASNVAFNVVIKKFNTELTKDQFMMNVILAKKLMVTLMNLKVIMESLKVN